MQEELLCRILQRHAAVVIDGKQAPVGIGEPGKGLFQERVRDGVREACVTCLVGESGCGKSLTAKACLRLLPSQARVAGAAAALSSISPPNPGWTTLPGDSTSVIIYRRPI